MTDKKTKPSLSFKDYRRVLSKIRPYLGLLLLLFLAVLYGYLMLEINSFNQAKPSQLQVSNDFKTTATPAISPTVVKKLEQMKSSSVSVQALFNQSRSNPFQ